MSLTKEQSLVVNTAEELYRKEGDQLLKVKAIAGAGKTHTLIELTKAINPKTGMYLAYNKAIQLEAAEKFKDTNIVCKTMHGLAYRETVIPYGLNVTDFNARSIDSEIPYATRQKLASTLESFFLSGSTDIHAYLGEQELTEEEVNVLLFYYKEMLDGRIGGGHSFYLKLYHILLANGTIPVPHVDLLMVDEFGDITALTIEIFKLIKAKLKVAVGDSGQNIYSFTHTINGFEALKGNGVELSLTKSFRVTDSIAKRIESFARSTFDKDMKFEGNSTVKVEPYASEAFIARNNATLIDQMADLDLYGVPFNLTRPPVNVFGLTLTLATLRPGKEVRDPKYKWLEAVALEHAEAASQGTVPKDLLEFLQIMYSSDQVMSSAIKAVQRLGTSRVFDLYEVAKKYYNDKTTYPITLTTAHSSKGLEFESVTLAEDMNLAVERSKTLLKMSQTPQAIDLLKEEFRLYYVAISRSMFELNNARYC